MTIDLKRLAYSELIKEIKNFQKYHDLKVDGIIGANTKYEMMFYKYKHFKKEEFKCGCDGKYCNGYPVKVDELLISQLELLRSKWNKPIHINSAIRCKDWNKEVGGVSNSQHLKGRAADIRVEGVSPKEVHHESGKIFSNGGVGSYKNFTHVDTRGYRVRFKGNY